MRNHLLVLILMCYGVIISPEAQSQLQKIYLHPKANGSEKQANVVDSIKFIPLEVKSSIEFSNYSSTQVTRDYFMVGDYTNKAMLLYGKNGRFIKKISYKHLGEGFYPRFDEEKNQLVFFGNNKTYALTPKDRVKIRLDWNSPRNRKYFKKFTIDLADTTFTFKKETPLQNDILHANYFYGDRYVMTEISTSELYKDSLDYEFKLYKDNQLVKGFFPYNRINEPRFLYTETNVGVNKTDTPHIHIITRPYCDTVYRMVGDSLSPYYQIVMPLENTLPASFFSTPFRNKTDRENFSRNNGWMLSQIYMFYESRRFIYLMIGYQSNFDIYVYNKQSQNTFKAKNIKADSSQYNLPLFEGYGMSQKNDKFYKTHKAGDILAFFEKNKQVAVPPELESFIKSKPPVTTPVIVEFKFKN